MRAIMVSSSSWVPSLILIVRAKTITIAELRDEKGELLVPERKIAYDTGNGAG